jgi:hypothetical protein
MYVALQNAATDAAGLLEGYSEATTEADPSIMMEPSLHESITSTTEIKANVLFV